MQQYPYGGPQPPPYGGPQTQPYGGQYGAPQQSHTPPPEIKKTSVANVAMAAISIACGLFAMYAPIPIIDVILGVVGIVLAGLAMRGGVSGLSVAGMVLSIVGTDRAFYFTIAYLDSFPSEWVLMFQPLI